MKPEYVKVDDKKYKLNTDFKVALRCNEVAIDKDIGEYEKVLAIIYLLFGDVGLEDRENHEKLLDLGLKYLLCGQEKEEENDGESPDMDFEQDRSYINASFRSDYGIDLDKENMHWWAFCELLNGLTEDCVLNRIRYVRNYDISDIKDVKEKADWIKRKKSVELKTKLTKEEQEKSNRFFELAKIERK